MKFRFLPGKSCNFLVILAALIGFALLASNAQAQQEDKGLKLGDTVYLNGSNFRVKRLENLPYVESEYTKRFKFDSFDNPKIKELRERYKLEAVVAAGKDEFEQQILLLDWVHHQFKKFGKPSTNTRGALDVLKGIDEGHSFFCTHYAEVFVSASASLGWVDRLLALRRHTDKGKEGSSEHSTTEMWSNQHRKWIMMDPTANMHVEKNGVALSAYEIRQEWFYHEGKDLVFVIGKERKPYRKTDLPIFLGRFAGFGDLTVPVDEMDKYGFTAYVPNTNLMDEREDYGKMFIVQDKMCDGTRWHTRTIPANPAVDAYFPVGQASLTLLPGIETIKTGVRTLTPNFKEYQAQVDGAGWKKCDESLAWKLHTGINRLEVRTVNQFGVQGPVSRVEMEQAN